MKRIDLSMKAQETYEVIKQLVDNHGNKHHAAIKLNCTLRHINRLITKYKLEGKASFIHGNTNRKPAHTLSQEQISSIIALYNNKYWDANFTHAVELMKKFDNISISPSTLRKILYNEYILSPRATKATRKRMNQILKQLHSKTKSSKQKAIIEASMVALEDSHSRRPRCAHFGEMLQMDASIHVWFGESKTQLHIAIDDCTGKIVGAYFDHQETLNGYYSILNQILNQYGIPHLLYTDNRTVFEYKRKDTNAVENDTYTQFSYACKQLGIEIKTTSIPQAKGRVERAFQTLQSRLPIDFRLKGILSMEDANAYLSTYIQEYNDKFSIPINPKSSVFIPAPNRETINQTLAVLSPRIIDNGHCIRYKKKYFKTMDDRGLQVYYHKGTSGIVIQAFDGSLLFATNNKVYALDEIPTHEVKSRNFDYDVTQSKPRRRNIPSMKHPWRNDSFIKYAKYINVTVFN